MGVGDGRIHGCRNEGKHGCRHRPTLLVGMYGVIHADIRGPVAVDMDVGMANQVG